MFIREGAAVGVDRVGITPCGSKNNPSKIVNSFFGACLEYRHQYLLFIISISLSILGKILMFYAKSRITVQKLYYA